MITSWFLVVTLCSATTGPATRCDDHIVDGDLTYTDCRGFLSTFPEKPGLYSLRCDKGESMGTVALVEER